MVHPVPSAAHQTAGATDSRASSPRRIGRYELAHRLGAGGMAEVHLARATGIEGFHKLVVLKRILPHLNGDPEFIRMFLTEARLAAMLDHPNIAQVFDLGIDGRDYYFVMEYVHGSNLQHILRTARRKRVKVELGHAVAVAIGALAGLHYAHDAMGPDGEPLGLVHRDISPTNLLVTHTGHVKLVDFGIAKVVNSTDFTRAGTRKGKVPYMSPEQCQSGKLDRRSDIFSAGIVLYELTTMSRLFTGDNEFAIMNQIVHGEIPPPSTIDRGYHPALEKIVMRALERDLTRRYQSALDMQLDLERFARDRRIWASPTSLAELMGDLFDEARRHPLEIAAAPVTPVSDPSVPSLPSVVGEPASFSGPDGATAISGAAIPALHADPGGSGPAPLTTGTGPKGPAPQLRTAVLGALTGIGVTLGLLWLTLRLWPTGGAADAPAEVPTASSGGEPQPVSDEDGAPPPTGEGQPSNAPTATAPDVAPDPEAADPTTEGESPEPARDAGEAAEADETPSAEPGVDPPNETPPAATPVGPKPKPQPKKKKKQKKQTTDEPEDSGGNLDSLLPG